MLKKVLNLILDGKPPDMFNETEPEERDIENYRYRSNYGNCLPGGADSESYIEDPKDTEKENAGEQRSPEQEIKTDSLNKFEVELKEPRKSPVLPIIRSILDEIFQNDLIDETINVLPLLQSHLCDTPHAGDEPGAQISVQSLDKIMDPSVSEAHVTIVADNVDTVVFLKLSLVVTRG